MKQSYVEVSQEAGKAFAQKQIKGEIMMLNLLKFREVADYSAFTQLAPAKPISGREAYARYIAHTLPFLREAGAEVVMRGNAASFLIGPSDVTWDEVIVVKHLSTEVFLSFAQNSDFLSGMGHRTAALEDSRLLPIIPH